MTKSSLEQIIGALHSAQVRYMAVGGIAVIAQGYVRLTLDVDLLIELERPNVIAALRALEGLGYRPSIPVSIEDFADPAHRREWIEQKQMKVLKLFSDAHRETTIDIFVDDPLGFGEAYARAESLPLTDNLNAIVCGYQDLVKLKLLAGRPKDLADLEQLKRIRGES